MLEHILQNLVVQSVGRVFLSIIYFEFRMKKGQIKNGEWSGKHGQKLQDIFFWLWHAHPQIVCFLGGIDTVKNLAISHFHFILFYFLVCLFFCSSFLIIVEKNFRWKKCLLLFSSHRLYSTFMKMTTSNWKYVCIST